MPPPLVSDTDSLSSFFAAGHAPEHMPELQRLRQAWGLLNAFKTLFDGSNDAVLVRLVVLRILASRAEAPRWLSQELDQHFAWIVAPKRHTILGRLKENGLLVWDASDQTYQVSATGRMVLAGLSHLLEIPEGPDTDLAYITAELAGAHSMGRVSPEVLNLLRSKYQSLETDLDDAIQSGSEFQLREAQKRLQLTHAAVQRGSEVIRALTSHPELDSKSYREAQAIGQAQARLLRKSAVFDRELGKFEHGRVLMGATGLSGRDIENWLRDSSAEALADQLADALSLLPQPTWLDTETAADIAEFELGRSRGIVPSQTLPLPALAPELPAPEAQSFTALQALMQRLGNIDAPTALADVLLPDAFAESSYRFSLLSLLGAQGGEGVGEEVAKLLALPLRLTLQAAAHAVNGREVAAVSSGLITPHVLES